MPIYEFECAASEHERRIHWEEIRPFSQSKHGAECPECGAACERVISLPFQAQGDFGTPRKAGYRMQKYTDDRLEGKTLSAHGEKLRDLGFETRKGEDYGIDSSRNPDL